MYHFGHQTYDIFRLSKQLGEMIAVDQKKERVDQANTDPGEKRHSREDSGQIRSWTKIS